jgi:hypothetical protein
MEDAMYGETLEQLVARLIGDSEDAFRELASRLGYARQSDAEENLRLALHQGTLVRRLRTSLPRALGVSQDEVHEALKVTKQARVDEKERERVCTFRPHISVLTGPRPKGPPHLSLFVLAVMLGGAKDRIDVPPLLPTEPLGKQVAEVRERIRQHRTEFAGNPGLARLGHKGYAYHATPYRTLYFGVDGTVQDLPDGLDAGRYTARAAGDDVAGPLRRNRR